MIRRVHLCLPAMLLAAITLTLSLDSVSSPAVSARSGNSYVRRNLISNRHDANDMDSPPPAQIIDPLLVNPWGAAIRTAGLGGHFWLANAGSASVTEYIGDVFDDTGEFIPLHQDALKVVPVDGSPIGQVFNTSDFGFPVRGSLCSDDGAEGCKPGDPSYIGEFTGPAKFIVATEEGQIAAWTEGSVNGQFGRMRKFANVIDNSGEGALYRGLAITEWPANSFLRHFGNYLYAANFSQDRIEIYDQKWRRIENRHRAFPWGHFTPFAKPAAVPADYRPFNIQFINGLLYVAYAQLIEPGDPDFDPEDPLAERACEGCGRIAVFTAWGQFVRMLDGDDLLNAPWGFALAPRGFGAFSGKLLVSNFGDGTITAFDLRRGKAIDSLRDPQGKVIEIDGIWAIFFGNGESLGRSDYLYWTAGYNDEEDGGFGTLHWSGNPHPSPQ
jgi:uncharacterized protein (TIGR03118 family)